MPQLDVSFVTADPMLADTFDVKRRAQTIDDGGYASTEDELYEKIVGVVTWESPTDLIRLPDAQMVPRKIFVATSFPIRGATKDYAADIVRYLCEDYTVIAVLPYSRFGGGTYEVIATSMTAMDQPIDPTD